MNPVVKRTLVGIVTGLLVAGLFLCCPMRAVLPVLVVLSSLVQLEFYQMARKYRPVTWFGLTAGAAWLTAVGLFSGARVFGVFSFFEFFPLALVLGLFLLGVWVLFRGAYANPVASVCSTLFGFFYVPFLLSFFLLFALKGAECADVWFDTSLVWQRHGLYTLFALVLVSKFSDTGGFAFGMALGRHKMCPSISPNKSWEGMLGSMLFSAAAAALTLWFARRFGWSESVPLWGMVSYPVACAAGAVIAVLATLGDLMESRFKRECGVKDSATFMPAGMGGFLDMFDSILFLPAIMYIVFEYVPLVAGMQS